jgi:peptide methionine sulfoxide reductase MsrB
MFFRRGFILKRAARLPPPSTLRAANSAAEKINVVPIQKIERTEAEWRELLSPRQFLSLRAAQMDPPFLKFEQEEEALREAQSAIEKRGGGGKVPGKLVYGCGGCEKPLFTHLDRCRKEERGWPVFRWPDAVMSTKQDAEANRDLLYVSVSLEIAHVNKLAGQKGEDATEDPEVALLALEKELLGSSRKGAADQPRDNEEKRRSLSLGALVQDRNVQSTSKVISENKRFCAHCTTCDGCVGFITFGESQKAGDEATKRQVGSEPLLVANCSSLVCNFVS